MYNLKYDNFVSSSSVVTNPKSCLLGKSHWFLNDWNYILGFVGESEVTLHGLENQILTPPSFLIHLHLGLRRWIVILYFRFHCFLWICEIGFVIRISLMVVLIANLLTDEISNRFYKAFILFSSLTHCLFLKNLYKFVENCQLIPTKKKQYWSSCWWKWSLEIQPKP